MTEQPRPPRVTVEAEPGSRMESLLAAYESAKAEAQEANDRFDAICEALKAEGCAAVPGSSALLLAGAPGLPKLRLTWHAPWRFDSKRFRRDHPRLYVQYEVRGGHWELRQED